MKLLADLTAWFDHRTGARRVLHEALYENIPGGSRWRYVLGSMLVFAFVTQVITGLFLWAAYSPSSETAWESVYYIQHEMQGGWLLRGIHHFMAQAMVVLLPLHLLQVVWDKAYKAPREVNYWLGLVLMQIVLALALTGYLLPWDQKGYWATRVATNLMSLTPVIGPQLQKVVVGGDDYGHHTLTRFFMLHAGLLPMLLVGVLALHLTLFRRHGITAKQPLVRPDQFFWPHQVFKDAVACLVVLVLVLLATIQFDVPGLLAGRLHTDHLGAELGAPADGSEAYSAARPEWYFLFLFQLLKYFKDEFTGAFVVPGLVMTFLFLMPFLARYRWGHRVNVAAILLLVAGAGFLTLKAFEQDHYHQLHAYDPEKHANDLEAQARYREPFEASRAHEQAEEEAERDAARARDLMRRQGGVGPGGALALVRGDSETQGPKLFARHCGSCHPYSAEPLPNDANDGSRFSAPNLYGFASREWLTGFFDPVHIKTAQYFGNTAHALPKRTIKVGQREEEIEPAMVAFVTQTFKDPTPERAALREALVAALSAEAKLNYQSELDAQAATAGLLETGRKAITGKFGCTDCHTYGDEGADDAPNLSGHGSTDWLKKMIANPRHFYGNKNDRMPAFAEGADPSKHQLSAREIDLLVRWLRRDDQ